MVSCFLKFPIFSYSDTHFPAGKFCAQNHSHPPHVFLHLKLFPSSTWTVYCPSTLYLLWRSLYLMVTPVLYFCNNKSKCMYSTGKQLFDTSSHLLLALQSTMALLTSNRNQFPQVKGIRMQCGIPPSPLKLSDEICAGRYHRWHMPLFWWGPTQHDTHTSNGELYST